MKRTQMKRRYRDTGPDAKTRILILERDNYCCIRCGRNIAGRDYSIHHRLPRGQGGSNSPQNLMTICGSGTTGCHGWIESRRAISYETGDLVRRRHDPATVPVCVHARGVVYLRPDGTYAEEAP